MSESGMTTIEVKKYNRQKVYDLVYSERAVSKQEISHKLNMGLTTVTQNLKALEEDGLILRTGYYESTGGRKAQAIEIAKNAKTAVGAFILKDKIILVALNLYGEVINSKTVFRDFSNDGEYCEFFGENVTGFARESEPDFSKISGVGIAIQGIVSEDGKVVSYGKLLHHTGLSVESLASGVPFKCSMMHDSKAAAYAEIWELPEINDAVVFLLNKNLGSALVFNRTVHGGKNMWSGTVEHMTVIPGGRPCYCGGKGCLETYCSAESLQKAADNIPIESFFHMLRAGNKLYGEIWSEFLSKLALGIRNSCTVADSDVILSGYLCAFMNESDIDELSKNIKSVPFFANRDIRIFVGRHGETAPAIGAALPFVKETVSNV